jgi:hypothetical protein
MLLVLFGGLGKSSEDKGWFHQKSTWLEFHFGATVGIHSKCVGGAPSL